MKGKFIVVTGPSASGKSRLVDALLQKIPDSTRLVTVTTRALRINEKNEIDYYFVSREEFKKKLQGGEFFEYAEVYGNLYGSSKIILESFLNRFRFVFAIINIQGAKTLKEKIPESCVLFLRPGSVEDVARRLRDERMGVPVEEIEKRIITAAQEMSVSSSFDHMINNLEGRFDETVTSALDLLGLL
jgi:guanylate kinase